MKRHKTIKTALFVAAAAMLAVITAIAVYSLESSKQSTKDASMKSFRLEENLSIGSDNATLQENPERKADSSQYPDASIGERFTLDKDNIRIGDGVADFIPKK